MYAENQANKKKKEAIISFGKSKECIIKERKSEHNLAHQLTRLHNDSNVNTECGLAKNCDINIMGRRNVFKES